MCIIIAKKKGVTFNMDTIEKSIRTGIKRNDDGGGFCVKREDNSKYPIFISKGYFDKTGNDIIDAIKSQKIKKEDELIIHLRYSTAGVNSINNCHPFGIPDVNKEELINANDCKINYPTVAHNGTFYEYVDSRGTYLNTRESKSDSLKFVEDVLVNRKLLPIFVEKGNEEDFFFDSFISSNKLAFLFPKGEMLLIGNFIEEDDGMMYSNEYYKHPFGNIKWDHYYTY